MELHKKLEMLILSEKHDFSNDEIETINLAGRAVLDIDYYRNAARIASDILGGFNDDICFQFSVISDERPASKNEKIKPKNHVGRCWFPRPMGDDVIVRYKFASKDDRKEYEESLPDWAKKEICRNPYIIASVREAGMVNISVTPTGYLVSRG